MARGDVSIGVRGEELLGLLYRFGALTVRQYVALSPEVEPEGRANGSRSRGNPYGRKLAARAEDIRRWARQGKSDREIAELLGIGETEYVSSFIERRNPYWRKLSACADDVRRWAEAGMTDEQIAGLLDVGDTGYVSSFVARRGFRESSAEGSAA